MLWSPLATIVTVNQAVQHLKLPPIDDPESAELDDLELKLEMATEEVLDYVSQRHGDDADTWLETVQGWTASTAPRRVKGAILAQFAYHYARRGDDQNAVQLEEGQTLCREAVNMVYRFRDPAIA